MLRGKQFHFKVTPSCILNVVAYNDVEYLHVITALETFLSNPIGFYSCHVFNVTWFFKPCGRRIRSWAMWVVKDVCVWMFCFDMNANRI